MSSIVVYSPQLSPRLTYVLDWLLTERLQLNYTITTNLQEAQQLPTCIAYGAKLPNAVSVPDTGLLWQQGIADPEITVGSWHDLPALFMTGHGETLPFDLFSAVFYLLSRYEEYKPFTPDKHGRYPATDSILYRKGILRRPIVDEWICLFCTELNKAGIAATKRPFIFQPTYDIDIAYSYLYKGAGRTLGGYLRALARLDVKQLKERLNVARRKQKDPYDSFRWLRQVHKQYGYHPLYFVLCAHTTTAFDKNIPPSHPAMVRVIKSLSKEATVGIHPSYYATSDSTFDHEKKTLEETATQKVTISRQHYIKLAIPATYRQLLQKGITDDYSMGYGAQLGFRAGTGSSFPWYDLQNECVAPLRIHPFCFMDTTAMYERKYPPAKAFERLREMTALLETCGSTLVTVFHNFSLGSAVEWKGWKHRYEELLRERSHNNPL